MISCIIVIFICICRLIAFTKSVLYFITRSIGDLELYCISECFAVSAVTTNEHGLCIALSGGDIFSLGINSAHLNSEVHVFILSIDHVFASLGEFELDGELTILITGYLSFIQSQSGWIAGGQFKLFICGGFACTICSSIEGIVCNTINNCISANCIGDSTIIFYGSRIKSAVCWAIKFNILNGFISRVNSDGAFSRSHQFYCASNTICF